MSSNIWLVINMGLKPIWFIDVQYINLVMYLKQIQFISTTTTEICLIYVGQICIIFCLLVYIKTL